MMVRSFTSLSLFLLIPIAALLISSVSCFTSIHSTYARSTLAPPFRLEGLGLSPSQRHINHLSLSDSDNEEPKEELTPDKMAEMIEVSFVNGVMQLAQGYIDVLKLFVAAVQSGYSLGISPTKLLETVTACPVQSANRPLMDEENELRKTWMQLVYLVLDFVQYEGKTLDEFADRNEIDGGIQEKYTKTIPILARAKEHGLSFDAERVEDCSHALPDSVNMEDPLEKALISQSLRLIWLTLVVLDEEEQCAEDKKPVKPQPPIPGAFD